MFSEEKTNVKNRKNKKSEKTEKFKSQKLKLCSKFQNLSKLSIFMILTNFHCQLGFTK